MLFQYISLIFLLFVNININQSINCISLSTIINPFNWYSFPPADLPISSSNSTDQANVSKYLQLIQSLFPNKIIGKQPSLTTETPITASSINFATTEFQDPTIINTVDDRSTINDIIKSKLKDSLTISTTPLSSFLLLKDSNNQAINFENDSVVKAITSAVNDDPADVIIATTPISIPLNTIDKLLMIADTNNDNPQSEQLDESQSNGRMETIAPLPTTTTTMTSINDDINGKDWNQQQPRSLQEQEKETISTIASVKFTDNEMITTTTEQSSPSQLISSSPLLMESMTADFDPMLNISELNPQTMIMENNDDHHTANNDNISIMPTTSASKISELEELDTINIERSNKYNGEETSTTTTMPTDDNSSKIDEDITVQKQSLSNIIDFVSTTTSASPLLVASTVNSISGDTVDQFKSTKSFMNEDDTNENSLQQILNNNNKSDSLENLMEKEIVNKTTSLLVNKSNNNINVKSSTMIMNENNDDNDDDNNNFIRKFHDAYYSNSAIFDDLMKRYSNERTNRAMHHFESNDEQQFELTANDIDTINRLFFENRDSTINLNNF